MGPARAVFAAFAGSRLWSLLRDIGHHPQEWAGYLSVIVPMGLFNVLGSLQNIESAEAAGDRFNTPASLGVNGLATIAASLFGSCFPTTIYIGHPGWKALGDPGRLFNAQRPGRDGHLPHGDGQT